jgi:hypoxanthine phosphoribosyltransferase
MHKTYLTQDEFNNMTLALSRQITATKKKFRYVYGIERGGVFISEPVSKYILATHRSFKISFYKENGEVNPEPVHDFGKYDFDYIRETAYTPFLLCDDLLDGGNTLNWFINKTGLVQGKHFLFACLFYAPHNRYGLTPDYWIREKKEDEWIVFPHEVKREAQEKALQATA